MRLIFTFLVMMIFSFSGIAQNKVGLKGPAAKNYKPWKDGVQKESVIVVNQEISVKGPKAKNRKPWEAQTTEKKHAVQITLGSNKRFLKGPAAKNYKPWKRKEVKAEN